MKPGIVKDKSYAFALRIISLTQWLREQKEFDIARQILRSGTSVGANVEEARETHYWLRLLRDSKIIPEPKISPLETESLELIRILTAIVKTS